MMKVDSTEIGDWKKEKILGHGSFGEVSLWTNSENTYLPKRKVAIKICLINTNLLQPHDNETFETRWLNEIEILKNLSNKYLVKWIDVPEFMTNKSLNIITMEYCELGDLRSQLCKFENCNGFQEIEVRNVLECLGKGLEFLHENKITHRDIKPDNIVITKVDGKKIYKMTDFGYAKELADTNAASMVGTQVYLAPEVVLTGEYSYRVDYWSLGVVVFEVICGERPFSVHDYGEFIKHIKKKKSDEIAISTDIKSIVTHHKHLHYENYLAFNFRMLIEKWLRLALEFDPIYRGFERVDGKKETTFYLRLQEALELKCLTIFSLWNYEFYSLPVTDDTTLSDLHESLAEMTDLEATEIDIILPLDHCKSLVTDKIIDLYSLEFDPMVFVATSKMGHSNNIKDLFISDLVRQIINTTDINISALFLKKFARKILYLVKNEQRKFVAYLKGLNAYALEVNDRLFKLSPLKNNIHMEAVGIVNSTKVFEFLINNSKDLIQNYGQAICENNFIQRWEHECNKTNTYINQVVRQISLLEMEYQECLNKSTENAQSEFLKDISQDYFDTKIIEKEAKSLLKTESKNLKLFQINEYKGLFENFVYACIEKRKKLLSISLESLHNNINQCNELYDKLSMRFNALSQEVRRQSLQVQSLLASHQKELFLMKDRNTTSISDSMNQLSLSSFCLEATDDVRQLIEENENSILETTLLLEEASKNYP